MPAPAAPAATPSGAIPDRAAWYAPGAVGGWAMAGGAWPAPTAREDRLVALWWSMRPIRTLPPPARRCLLVCLGSGQPALVRAALRQDWPALAALGMAPLGGPMGR
jgi:hypothetical protein